LHHSLFMNESSLVAVAKTSALRLPGLLLSVGAGLFLLAGALHAGPVPKNLGSGLDVLVEAKVKLQTAQKDGTASTLKLYSGYASKAAENASRLMIKDEHERILVRVQPNGIVPVEKLEHRAEEKVPQMRVQATDRKYHGVGAFEAFVPLDEIPKIAGLEGVSGVFLTPKPIHAGLRMKNSERTLREIASLASPEAVAGESLNEIGTVFDFGVTQHRVDQINRTYNSAATADYEGATAAGVPINIGDLSDSFGNTTTTTAATDMANGDLPGGSFAVNGQVVNSTPVYVLQDYTSGGTDEGRAMCQTLFKMAPKANLAFATADFGELQFADNIRSLANLTGYKNPQNFAADVIVDDVSYLDEPFFQDGIIAEGVNDVTAAGVSYFSSAANNPGTNGYDSDFRFVSESDGVTTSGLGVETITGTNCVLNGTNAVPTEAYAGGFHNFNASGTLAAGTEALAQTVNFPNSVVLADYTDPAIPNLPIIPPTIIGPIADEAPGLPVVLQWNDPDNTTTPSYSTTPTMTSAGTFPVMDSGTVLPGEPASSPNTSYSQMLAAGQEYYIALVPSSTLDGQITIADSTGTVLSFTDNNGKGGAEYATFFPPTTGIYTISVTAYQNAVAMDVTYGAYTLNIYTASGTDQVTQNLNLLVFDTNGNYIPGDSVTTNGIASGSPIKFTEFVAPPNATQLQFVIARSTPVATGGGRTADHFRYLCFGDGIVPLGPAQYFSYTTPLTFGHSCAALANAVAAYPYYKPNIPEFFTSPGPSTQYFDANNNYTGKVVRLKPDIAAMDGANTSFFGSDDDQDTDSSDNFFGTSDAAPHAAAIAALVLGAHGGKGSVTPAQMKSVLQRSTFAHDLDPYVSKGMARTTTGGRVSVIFKGDDEDSTVTTNFAQGTAGIQDPNSITVQYEGPGYLTSLSLNPSGAVATAGNVTDGVNGLTTPASKASTYFFTSTPGVVFDTSASTGLAFTTGTCSPAALSSAVTSALSNNDMTLTLTFTAGDFLGGDILRFTIGRDELDSAEVTSSGASDGDSIPNGSADIIGGGVSIPDGDIDSTGIDTQIGMSFSGTTSDGTAMGTFGPGALSPGSTSQTGYIRNRIGSGYSALDGFGFIDAQKAVTLPLQ
jgi:hypothetical protein